jgi:hypothetical protein
MFPRSVNGSGKLKTQTFDVSNFDSVTLQGSGNVFVRQGDEESLSVETDDNILPYLDIRVSGNELILSTKPNLNLNPTKSITYNLTVKDLKGISLKGSGNFSIDPLQSDAMDILLSGSGDIKFKDLSTDKFSMDLNGSGNISADQLEADTIEASIRGSGDTSLSGKSESQTVSFSGSGNYRAGDLETSSTDIDISGSADLTVWVTDELDVKVNGSGTVSYYGKPTINETGSGSGKLVSLGEK